MAAEASTEQAGPPPGENNNRGGDDGGTDDGSSTLTTSGKDDGGDGDAQLLRRVCLEYAATLLREDTASASDDADGSGTAATAQTGAQPAAASARAVARLRELVDKGSAQAWELQSVLESAENDITVTQTLLAQLRANTRQLANTFRLVDSLCHALQRVEQATMATRQQCREVQAAYDARHPKSIQRFLGSINVFRSKKTAEVQRPPMPVWRPLEPPLDVDAEFRSLRQQAWATPVKSKTDAGGEKKGNSGATSSQVDSGSADGDAAADADDGGGGRGGGAGEEKQGAPGQTLPPEAAGGSS